MSSIDVSDLDVTVARKLLLDLPDEVLQLILGRCDVATVLTCETMARGLTASEETWQKLCEHEWPLLLRALRTKIWPAFVLPPASWRDLFRSRVLGHGGGPGWRELLPLYDLSMDCATERRPGWVCTLGTLLLRIDALRRRQGLPAQALEDKHHDAKTWARSLYREVFVRGMDEVLTFAGDAQAAGRVAKRTGYDVDQLLADSIAGQLDRWYDLADTADKDASAARLAAAYTGRSALEAIIQALEIYCTIQWEYLASQPDESKEDLAVHAAANNLTAEIVEIDECIKGFRDEGCDCSLSAAQRRRLAPHSLSLHPLSHWWWALDAPLFVSGGNPYLNVSVP